MSEITIRQPQAINAIWRVKWADPIAAFTILPLIVWEGREAMPGRLAAVASFARVHPICHNLPGNDRNCGTWDHEYNQQLDFQCRLWTLKGTAWDHHQ
jgi:hypothetical protein